jgi:5'-nucleotidase/UDP-sugar diphosphatase
MGATRTVRILQTGAYGRFLGRLDLDLAVDGRIAAQGGSTIPMGAGIAEDARVAALVADLARPLEETRRRPVGRLPMALPNTECRRGECALGNLVAEAMLGAIPGAEVAFTNGGGLRAGLPDGQVTIGDVLTVLPFGNTVAVMGLRGADVLAAIEHGLSQGAGTAGRFPQVAGIRFAWDPTAPAWRARARGAGGAGGGVRAARPGPRVPRGDQRLHAEGGRRIRDVPRPRAGPLRHRAGTGRGGGGCHRPRAPGGRAA